MKEYVIYIKWLSDNTEDTSHAHGYSKLCTYLKELKSRPEIKILNIAERTKTGEFIDRPMIKKYI